MFFGKIERNNPEPPPEPPPEITLADLKATALEAYDGIRHPHLTKREWFSIAFLLCATIIMPLVVAYGRGS